MDKVDKVNFHIETCIRVRPAISEDFTHLRSKATNSIDSGNNYQQEYSCVEVGNDGKTVKLLRDSLSIFDKPKCFSFDHVFGFKCTQIEVYRNTLQTLVENLVYGYNGTCFVYGQTGSGKTFTMFGSEQLFGIAHLAINDIFEGADRRKEENNLRTTVSVSFIQVFVEQVYDLLVTDNKKSPVSLNIHEDAKKGIHVENLRLIPVSNKEECHELISHGLYNRRVRSTEYNMKSSRSHAILQLNLDIELNSSRSKTSYRSQKLTLVDLAGAERPNNYKISNKQHFKEAVIINKSISALGNCIKALATISQNNAHQAEDTSQSSTFTVHVPFRDCRLTRLLAVPLGGNSRICLIANIGPCASYYDETMSTLKFASRAITVTKSVKKETVKQASFPLSKFLLDPIAFSSPPVSERDNSNQNSIHNHHQENLSSKNSPGQVDYTSDFEDASQLTSMDELSTLHSSSHATISNYSSTAFNNNNQNNNNNNKFSVQEFLSMKHPKSSPVNAVYPFFSQPSHTRSGSKSPDQVRKSSSLCSYTFDDCLMSTIEQQQKEDQHVLNSIDDFDAGVDAIRVYKLKTANKQIQKIIRDRSPSSTSSTIIRHKKSPMRPRQARNFDSYGSFSESGEQGFGSKDSLFLSAESVDKNQSSRAGMPSSFYSTSREHLAPSQPQPNIHLISLDSHYARRSKCVGEEWPEDESIVDKFAGDESSTLDSFATPPCRTAEKKGLSSNRKQQFEEAGASGKDLARPPVSAVKEMSLMTFLSAKSRIDASTPNMGSFNSTDLELTPSPPPPPPPPPLLLPPRDTTAGDHLVMAPFSPAHVPWSSPLTETSIIYDPETVVTLCLPSSTGVTNQDLNSDRNPTPTAAAAAAIEDLEADSAAQPELRVSVQPPSEEQIISAIELARSFCKEFQSVITAAAPVSTVAATGEEEKAMESDTVADKGRFTPLSGQSESPIVPSVFSSSTTTSSVEVVLSGLPVNMPAEGDAAEVKKTPDVNEICINTDVNVINEPAKDGPTTTTEDTGSEPQPDISGFFDGTTIDDERKLSLLGQLHRNKLVSLVLELQQEVSKKSKEINELQTFILDL